MPAPTTSASTEVRGEADGWTPGPWFDAEGTTTGRIVTAPFQPKVRRSVAACGGQRRDANARLIAAAPEMVEALDACQTYFANISGMTVEDAQDALTTVRAALAKARGAA